MGNSLLDITPHVVSRDLTGYSVLLYGEPKSGKTTTASKFPNSLLLAFELGYNALPGVMAKPMSNWRDMKVTLKELDDPAVKERFKNIIIDTADLAYDAAKKYVCNQNEVNDISEMAYGKGYNLVMKEFDEAIRAILRMGYGCILISHATDKTFKDAQGNEFNQIVPTIDNKGRLVCERTCDIIGYSRTVETSEGEKKTKLFLRETPRFVAGSRFKYMPDYIDFSYDNLVNAIHEAIDKEALEHGNAYVTDESVKLYMEVDNKPALSFDAVTEEFQTVVGELMNINAARYQKEITVIVEKYLGLGKKVMDCSSKQVDQIALINDDLKTLLNEAKQ
jgi:hypothetical protein